MIQLPQKYNRKPNKYLRIPFPFHRTLLEQQHVDVNAGQLDGTTALHWAAEQDDFETAKLLVGAGADARAVNRYGVTPLSLACTNGNGAMVGLLLKAGADANAEQVKRGTAWAYTKYLTDPSIKELENDARFAKRGLWTEANPVPPWEWRKSKQ